MTFFRYLSLLLCLLGASLSIARCTETPSRFPAPEKLTYEVNWRLVSAGTATVGLSHPSGTKNWQFDVSIASAGLVSRLYRVLDSYKVSAADTFCLVNAALDAEEGKRHSVSKFSVEPARRKLNYEEHDLVKNQTEKKQLDVPPCTYEILGALAALRMSPLETGRSMIIPITDGKKFSQAKIEAQKSESVSAGGKTYSATRYEAYLFDNVLYKRRGRLLIWLSDSPDHVPVLFRLLLGFPIGTITVELQKQEK